MSGFTFFNAHSAIADVIDSIWDVDVPDEGLARSLAIKVLPSVAPTLCLHYRAAMDSGQRLNPGLCRQRGTGVQTRAVTVQPTGPIGAVNVHLRPQAASRLMGGCMEEFTDANIALSDIFGGLEVSLLEERIAEAETAAERVHCVQSFLHEQIGENRVRCDSRSRRIPAAPRAKPFDSAPRGDSRYKRAAVRAPFSSESWNKSKAICTYRAPE